VTGYVLEDAGALAVLVGLQLFDHTRATITRTSERRVDVGYADLDQVRRDALTRRNSVATDLGDDDGAV
jgi:hypothetical protein